MEKEIILYQDKYFYITKCKEFPNVPGLFAIYENGNKWDSSEISIKRLALIEKTIRDELMNQGIDLVGIYREEYENGTFRILIIPYDVKILKQNNISPDLYQPYIKEYLESFKKKSNNCNNKNAKIMNRLKEIKNGEPNRKKD